MHCTELFLFWVPDVISYASHCADAKCLGFLPLFPSALVAFNVIILLFYAFFHELLRGWRWDATRVGLIICVLTSPRKCHHRYNDNGRIAVLERENLRLGFVMLRKGENGHTRIRNSGPLRWEAISRTTSQQVSKINNLKWQNKYFALINYQN